MTTAKTTQLLDANNNNISPATSVESLYFEMNVSSGETYRMGVFDRLVIAGQNTLVNEQSVSSSNNYFKCEIPFTYVSTISGVSSLYEINSSVINLGNDISTFINKTFEDTYLKADQSTNYIPRNLNSSNNSVYNGAIRYLNSENDSYSDYKMEVGKLGSEYLYGIKWNNDNYIQYDSSNNNSSLGIKTDSLNIYSQDITIGSGSNYITFKKEADISILTQNLSINASLNIKSNDISIVGKNINISTTSDNYVNIKKLSVDSSLKIRDKEFPKYPDSSDLYCLTIENKELDWRPYQYTHLKDEITFTNSSVVEFRRLSDSSNNRYSLFRDPSIIYVKTINNVPLLNDSSSNIECVKINGIPVINSSTDFHLVNDGSLWTELNNGNNIISYEQQKRFITNVFIDETGEGDQRSAQIKFEFDSDVYVKEGQLYARKVFMASDEKLKTNITDAPYDIKLPELKEFVWKDTSVKSYGVIAQDVENIGLNELVNDNGEKKSVDYIPLLCLMIKNLQKRVESLEEQLNLLKK